jgi:hypothetical protein
VGAMARGGGESGIAAHYFGVVNCHEESKLMCLIHFPMIPLDCLQHKFARTTPLSNLKYKILNKQYKHK